MVEHANAAHSEQASLLAGALLSGVAKFARKLRWLGAEVSIVELTDALRAVRDADLLDRDRLRRLLQVTMIKRAPDVATFRAAFDLLFPGR